MTQSNGDRGPDEAPPQSDRITAEHYGKRIAAITRRLHHGAEFDTERFSSPIADAIWGGGPWAYREQSTPDS